MNISKNPNADSDFSNAPYFNFNDGKLKFDTNWSDNANANYGSASAFLPKSLRAKRASIAMLFYFISLLDLIQPPSILPISKSFIEN